MLAIYGFNLENHFWRKYPLINYPVLPANSMEKEEQEQGIESTDLGQDLSRPNSPKQHLSR